MKVLHLGMFFHTPRCSVLLLVNAAYLVQSFMSGDLQVPGKGLHGASGCLENARIFVISRDQ